MVHLSTPHPIDQQLTQVNQRLKYVYGMVATYGLRNHEVFF